MKMNQRDDILPEFIDLSGKQFGRWTVIKRVEDHVSKGGTHYTQYECMCECGTVKNVVANSLRNGRSYSCGCFGRERAAEVCRSNFKTHGNTKDRLYQIYAGMKKRCFNRHAYNYSDYGGRGITICKEWLDDWVSFRTWALDNGYNENLSIDRIDVNGDYEPGNCRWVDCVAQANNRRSSRYITYNNEEHTIAEWAKILNIPYKRLHKWIYKGKTMEEIMAT